MGDVQILAICLNLIGALSGHGSPADEGVHDLVADCFVGARIFSVSIQSDSCDSASFVRLLAANNSTPTFLTSFISSSFGCFRLKYSAATVGNPENPLDVGVFGGSYLQADAQRSSNCRARQYTACPHSSIPAHQCFEKLS